MRVNKILLGVLSLIFLFSGCNKTKAETANNKENQIETIIPVASSSKNSMELDESNNISYESLKFFMKPDYTSQKPEIISSEKNKINAVAVDSKEKSESIIPGIRKLNDYATKYSSERKKITYKSNQKVENGQDNPNIEFKITDWGPQGKISALSENPSFYVVFSQPVHVLSALEEPTDKSEIMSIEPALKGKFRWYGTKHLAFEAEEPADPAIEYIIRINPATKSLGGAKLQGQQAFRTKADEISIKRFYGGYIGKGEFSYNAITGALPPYENRFFINLNYKITEETLNKILTVKVGNTKAAFTSEILYKPESTGYGFNEDVIKFDEENKKSNSFIITITDDVPHNASVTASTKGVKNNHTYYTLKPFKIVEVPDYTNYTNGTKNHPLTIRFTQIPEESTIAESISFDFDYKLTKDNFEIDENYLTLFNLPIDFDEKHSITFKDTLKDIYGQEINLGPVKTYNFTVRNALSYVKYLDYGAKMLEAQFPHKMVFEYQNLNEDSYYLVSAVNNPFELYSPFYKNNEYITNKENLPSGTKQIPQGKKNTRQFMEVDFDPYLNNGFGFVKFDSMTRGLAYNYWNDKWEVETDSQTITVQVTDLGITTRMGINKAVIMVRSLSTGKPVENAEVKVLLNSDFDVVASGKTDKNGFCVIEFTEDQILQMEKELSYYYDSTFRILVVNGDDKAVFTPNSHSVWGFGNIHAKSRKTVRRPVQRTFIFTDRGLYKPGETVTFRGIDRDQLLGNLKAHCGHYYYLVQGSGWDAPIIKEKVYGNTSESGGFYDSFQLPDNLEPGSYRIEYGRVGSEEETYTSYCYFTVAEFERLKLQAQIEVPEITYYGGDKISAEVSAEYFAGGSLSGAEYTSNWYKQGQNFNPDTPETKNFSFGPYDKYSWRNYFSSDSGNLSTNGTAQLNCTSEKITDGLTYDYRLEANITDISNQRVMAAASIKVHPALYYIGLRKSNGNGFAKKGEKLEFPYILVDTKGKLLSKEDYSKVGSLSYSLKRDEWTMVHEQSVNSTVYTRYEKTVVEEKTGSLQAGNSEKLELTPENSGWYTLEISGTDSKKNKVITSIGFYVTGSGMLWHGNSDSEELTLTPDQNLYNPGDTAQILLQSPLQKGDYLITVEREGIFTEEIRHFDEPANVIEIPIAANYVPRVYVAVSSYSERNGVPTHEYGEPDLDKPKEYFGLAAINVNPYVRAFSIDIETDKSTYKPGEEATITVKATKGGAPLANAELTLMAVDRGVLDLINYHVPNPIEYFYSPENFPLRVSGGDSRSLLMDPVTYSLKNLAGGDAAESSDEEKEEDERKDYRPTAFFEPALITDNDGTAKVTFTLPDSLTTYRITAFGIRDDLFALEEVETKVQNPINIQSVQPRKLRERDTAECGVLITNLDNKTQEVNVKLEIRKPSKESLETASDGKKSGTVALAGEAFIDGAFEHSVKVAAGDSTVVYFDVGAKKEGVVELVYTINSEPLNEKMVSKIAIEKTYTYETVTLLGDTGEENPSYATEYFDLPGFAENGRGDLSITLDPTRLGLLSSSVNYLFDYPYGCLEQQSSKMLPLIIFGEYIDAFDLNSKVTNLKKCVTSYTNNWAKSQLTNGAFPYWPDSKAPSLYVSIRIAHICAVALQRGYSEKELGIDIKALIAYVSDAVNKIESNDYLKAYACYVVKMLDYHSLDSTLSALYKRIEQLPLTTAAFVSLAYSEDDGLNSLVRADEINKKIRAYLQPVERSVTILDANRNDDFWFWYESPIEQMAVIMQAFVKVDPNDQMVDRLLFTLLKNQKNGYWRNTSTTARSLEAIYTLIKMRNLDNTDYKATVNIQDKAVMSETFEGVGAKPKTLKLPFESEILSQLEKDTPIPVKFEKDGEGRLYYTVEMKYALPDEMLFARNEGLNVTYQILDYETEEPIVTSGSEDSLLTLETGRLYKASIRVESTRDRTYLALRAPIPSGAEILDSTFVTVGAEADISYTSNSWGHWLSNKVIRDNEIQFFWDNFRTGSATVNFTFRAARRGIYPTPPVHAECMYEPEIFGRTDGYLVQIK